MGSDFQRRELLTSGIMSAALTVVGLRAGRGPEASLTGEEGGVDRTITGFSQQDPGEDGKR